MPSHPTDQEAEGPTEAPPGAPAAPLISVVTVSYRDCWALSKTARSVSCQRSDFEYVVVDGGSDDGTAGLVSFWRRAGLIDRALIEPDRGVYDAMNKGARIARGRFVVFLNAGDVFAHDDVLAEAAAVLRREGGDGVLGWGELNGRIWASWHEGPGFKLSSLGFCHQALFLRRSLLLAEPFDDRPFKTDSDTLQLGRAFTRGAQVRVVPSVWARRGGDPGLSADLERTARSITDTITSEYGADEETAGTILAFRRRGERADEILDLLATCDGALRRDLGLMVLDSLFQPSSKALPAGDVDALREAARAAAGEDEEERLLAAQGRRLALTQARAETTRQGLSEIAVFAEQEDRRAERDRPAAPEPASYTIALTSFPARLRTLPFVVRALVEQTRPPDEIVLTLGRDEVPNRNWLPKPLLAFEERGLRVVFVDKTFHQYDKYVHAAERNAARPFVIVDDDVIHHPYAMARLLEGHETHPGCVVGNRCHLMGWEGAGFAPYRDWQRERRAEAPSLALMPTGAGGVLYPPGFLTRPSVTDVDLITAHAPYADDLWLKFNALAAGVPTYATVLSQGGDWYHRYTPTMRAGTLMDTNVERGLNDRQVEACAAWLDEVAAGWRAELEGAIRLREAA